MSRNNFTPRQRVAHKLAGAAYQMTFVEDYDRAIATMANAAEFWESTRDDPLTDEEAAEIYNFPTGDVTVQLHDDDVATETDTSGDERITGSAYDEIDEPDEPKLREDLHIPKPGTNSRRVVEALLRAHDDGKGWVEPVELEDYGVSDRIRNQLSAVGQYLDYIQWQKVDGQRANQYRIRTAERGALRDALS